MPSKNKQKIYIILVIIFFASVLEILPEQVTTIVPAILFIWETCALFFNKNALAGYKLWFKKNYKKQSNLIFLNKLIRLINIPIEIRLTHKLRQL